MQWFTLSQGKRAGPYSTAQLREMFQSDEITLDTLIVPQGSPLARKVFCSPEIFFADMLAEAPRAAAQVRPAPSHSATRIARLPRLSPTPQMKPDRVNQGKEAREDRAQKLAEPRTDHTPIVEPKPKENLNSPTAKKLRSVRDKKRKIQAEDSPRSMGSPPSPASLPVAPVAKKTEAAVSRANNDTTPQAAAAPAAPAHQLPKAVSEAQIQTRDFAWAKNRVNPTAPRSIFHMPQNAEVKRPKTRTHRKSSGGLPWEVKLLMIGLVAVLALIFVAHLIVSRPSPPRQPRFSQQQNLDFDQGTQTASNAIEFDEAQPIIVPTNEKPNKRDAQNQKTQTKPAPKNTSKKKETKRQSSAPAAKSAPAKKAPAASKSPQKTTSLRARAPQKPAQNAVAALPKIRGSEDLAKNLFKQVSLESVRILQSPNSCAPCQVPAVLRDGTKILLTSTNMGPWQEIQRTKSLNIKATGLLTRSGQGTYTVIVKDVRP